MRILVPQFLFKKNVCICHIYEIYTIQSQKNIVHIYQKTILSQEYYDFHDVFFKKNSDVFSLNQMFDDKIQLKEK